MICQDIGPPDAKIVLVGEAPGANEERTGVPFAGASGNLLKQMLSHSGISFHDCYVTNVMNVRPPNNKFQYFYDGKLPGATLEAAIIKLRDKIEQIRPNVIITLGAEALRAVCNKRKITAYRGTWLSFRDIPVLPTFHPSYVLRQYQSHVIVEMDLAKAVSGKMKLVPQMILGPSTTQVLHWCHTAVGRVSYDIETVGKHVRCISFACNGRVPICVPFIRFKSSDLASVGAKRVLLQSSAQAAGSYWSPQDEVRVIDAIQRLFDSGIQIVGQNSIGFDAPLLYDEFGIVIKEHFMDTMHAWHCARADTPIRTLRGIKSIQNVTTDDYVWGWENDLAIPVKVVKVACTQRDAKLVRIEFWHRGRLGEGCIRRYLDVTPDHKVRLTNGTWRHAKDLRVGDSLTRLKAFTLRDGNEYICQGRKVSRVVYNYLKGPIPEGRTIHHKDSDVTNNMPNNLACLSTSEHNTTHGRCPPSQKGKIPWNYGHGKLNEDRVREMYESGMSAMYIADIFGVNQSTVSRFMKRHCISTRCLSAAQQTRRSNEKNAKVLRVHHLEKTYDVYDIMVDDPCCCFAANDIMIHNCLYSELPMGLSFLCSVLTDYANYWTDKVTTDDISEWKYNTMDSVVTLEVSYKIEQELKESDFEYVN